MTQPALQLPSLRGRNVALRPIGPADHAPLQVAEVEPWLGPRWRFRGTTPSPDVWGQATWANALARFLVVARRGEDVLGVVAAYGASFQDGHAQISAARFGEADRSPRMMLGLALFIDYVFACWDLRKLYMEVPEYNLEQFASGLDDGLRVEGRLRAHSYLAGRHWDHVLLALYRADWPRISKAALRLERGG